MIATSSYLLFLGACVALIAMPGPSQALVLARTLGEGPRSGALTAVGLNLGTLCHALAAALGLSSILASSPLAFAVVKYAGAAYLVYLGIRALQSPASPASPATPGRSASLRSPLLRALATGVLNPKVALFFLAFLPQFVDPTEGVFLQFLLLGATLAVLDTCYELLVVWLVSRMKGAIASSPRAAAWQRRTSGSVLVALGLGLAIRN
jgi:threonine/homoserine/homoserine lactone efflux protein